MSVRERDVACVPKLHIEFQKHGFVCLIMHTLTVSYVSTTGIGYNCLAFLVLPNVFWKYLILHSSIEVTHANMS